MNLINTEKNGADVNKMKSFLSLRLCLLLIFVLICPIKIAHAIGQCLVISNFGKSETNAWWIPSASFNENTQHKKFMSQIQRKQSVDWNSELFPISGHNISNGEGDILAYRRFFAGYSEISDSSSIVLITISTLKPLVGSGEISVGGLSGATVFITTGNVGLHDFCTGYAVHGSIHYTSSAFSSITPSSASKNKPHALSLLGIDEGVYAEVSIEFDMIDPENLWPEKCKRCIFDANLVFKLNNIPLVNKELTRGSK